MDRRPGAPIKPDFGLTGVETPSPAHNLYCGVGLGVAVGDGIACCAAVAGVALGTTAGVGLVPGVAVADGDASCAGLPADVGADGVGVATALGVGLGFGCMFLAFLSVSFPSGPKKIPISLFCALFPKSWGTKTTYCHVEPKNLSFSLLNSHRA